MAEACQPRVMALDAGGEQAIADPSKVVAGKSGELEAPALREGALHDRHRAQLVVEGIDEARQLARLAVLSSPCRTCGVHAQSPAPSPQGNPPAALGAGGGGFKDPLNPDVIQYPL